MSNVQSPVVDRGFVFKPVAVPMFFDIGHWTLDLYFKT